ncbi:hypothetical protein [Nocardiopsis halotolerans]|uniref:hypothetical protein n=1 Tax=Nocardiopsis halotolerans TaxID=124252 RepID=UPI000348EA3A|nr:hypothetical protein [Nocardiopsis halotolerans]
MLRYPNLGFATGLVLAPVMLLAGAVLVAMLFTMVFTPDLFLDRFAVFCGVLVVGGVSGLWIVAAFDEDLGDGSTWRDAVISGIVHYGGGLVFAGMVVFELLLPVWAIIAQHLS